MLATRTQVKLALRIAARKRALAHYKRFMLTAKPNLKMSWSETEMEQLAAIMMQAAWRRRQVLSIARCGRFYLTAWHDMTRIAAPCLAGLFCAETRRKQQALSDTNENKACSPKH